jgi:hypothetical protein
VSFQLCSPHRHGGELWEASGKHSIRTRSVHDPNGAEAGPDLVGTQILTGDHFRDPPVRRGARDVGGAGVAHGE